jgi:hypothetical protein
VWYIVEAIKRSPELDIDFPSTHAEQKYVADGFRGVYDADFACCVGAVDGILIWTHKPSEEECERGGSSSGKFLCGRKNKFGLNCQDVCDVHGKFLDVSFVYQGSTSDLLVLDGSSLMTKRLGGFLHAELYLSGDKTYVNAAFMATQFIAVSGVPKMHTIFILNPKLEFKLRRPLEC